MEKNACLLKVKSQIHVVTTVLKVLTCMSVRQTADYQSWSFLLCAFSHNIYIFHCPTKCTCAVKYLYCLL